MKGSETEQTLREIKMIGTERLLSELKRLPEQLFTLLKLIQGAIDRAQTAH